MHYFSIVYSCFSDQFITEKYILQKYISESRPIVYNTFL